MHSLLKHRWYYINFFMPKYTHILSLSAKRLNLEIVVLSLETK